MNLIATKLRNKEYMNIEIRKYHEKDKEELSRIIIKCLTDINSRDYPDKIINAMINHFTPEQLHQYSLQNICLVAEFNESIAGTISLGNDIIYTTFVDPDFHGHGIGKKLVEKIEEIAGKSNISILKVPSSITAEGFYRSCGYVSIDEEFDNKFGASIIMEKDLAKNKKS